MASSLKGALFSLIFSLFLASTTSFQVTFAAAPLIMLFYTGSLRLVLWAAVFSGLLMDAILLTPRFGLLAVSYLLSVRFLYPFRLYFFKDSQITLPALSFLFSLLSRVIEALLVLFFDLSIPRGYLQHLLVQPFFDLFFACGVFMLPIILWHQYAVRRKKRRYINDS